ncbi:3-oxoadipate enol-lactonase, partial [Enterococcus faecium]
HYAGDSVGGAVGLQLALDAPNRMSTATLMCTGAVIGTPDGWRERAATVRADGIAPMVAASPQRWFAAGFVERRPGVAAALMD